jgi:Prokaryotic dksA/traR C4-type zinc finger
VTGENRETGCVNQNREPFARRSRLNNRWSMQAFHGGPSQTWLGPPFLSFGRSMKAMAKTRRCQRCQAEIPAERIEAVPETRLCVRCSQDVGSDFVVSVTQENVGKSGSLKKNYGGVHIQKRRRRIEPLS